MYEDYKIYGPYLNKKDNRLRVVLINKTTKEKRTISYPKYLMECHLGRYLAENETVDHLDGNPLNNDISNLKVIDRKEHSKSDVMRNMDVEVLCTNCKKPFIIKGESLPYTNRRGSGYFCSKKCSGSYGRKIQMGKIVPEKVERIKPTKYKAKSARDENPGVEVG